MHVNLCAARSGGVNPGPGIADVVSVAERVVILSDLHLGRARQTAGSAALLRPIWQGASQLILNGDTAEVHHKDQWSQSARQVMQLFDMCEEDDVKLTLVSGNHDPFLSDTRAISLAGGLVFVTHGDVFHPAVAPWSPRAAKMLAVFTQAMATIDPESRGSLEDHLLASQHASHAEWQVLADEDYRVSWYDLIVHPLAFVTSMRYWHTFPRLAAKFAAKHAPQARFVIFGHTHCSSVNTIGAHTVINTGGFGMHRKPLAVVVEDEQLSVFKIVRRGGLFHLADRAHAVFALKRQSVVARPPVDVSAA